MLLSERRRLLLTETFSPLRCEASGCRFNTVTDEEAASASDSGCESCVGPLLPLEPLIILLVEVTV